MLDTRRANELAARRNPSAGPNQDEPRVFIEIYKKNIPTKTTDSIELEGMFPIRTRETGQEDE